MTPTEWTRDDADHGWLTCPACDEPLHVTDGTAIDGEWLCLTCATKYGAHCARCGRLVWQLGRIVTREHNEIGHVIHEEIAEVCEPCLRGDTPQEDV